MSEYRNPSPPSSPPGSEQPPSSPSGPQASSDGDSDRIGDSVFSRHWVLGLLVRVVQYVSSRNGDMNGEARGSATFPQQSLENGAGEDMRASEESSKVSMPPVEDMDAQLQIQEEASEESSKVNSLPDDTDAQLHGASYHGDGKLHDADCHRDCGFGSNDEEDGGDFDSALEEELCLLWDASMNSVRSIIEFSPHYLSTVMPPNKGHFGASHVVLCRETVLFSEVQNVGVL